MQIIALNYWPRYRFQYLSGSLTIAERLTSVKGIVVLIDADQMPVTSLSNVMNYEVLLNTQSEQYDWPLLDADSALAFVIPPVQQEILKGFFTPTAQLFCMRMLAVIPMYHMCAWGILYIAAMSGASLVLPGDGMAGEDLYRLIEYAQVDLMLGVPTVWLGLIDYLKANNLIIPSVKTVE